MKNVHSGDSNQADKSVTILDLPTIITRVFERAQKPLLPGAQGPLGLFVRYLRRKPKRGLAVIYSVDELHRDQGHAHSGDPRRSVSLTLDEIALEGAHIRFNEEQVQQTPVEVLPSGVLRASEIGLSVQTFPADGSLPALAASCDTAPSSQLFLALEAAARLQLNDGTWRLISAEAIPVRYKPANRCVIRYALSLASTHDNTLHKNLALFGKVYADPAQARSTQEMMLWLYEEQMTFQDTVLAGLTQRSPLLPRPLGTLDELGLTLNEAVQPADPQDPLHTGTKALQPAFQRGRGGEITAVVAPEEELRLTAVALARLHTSKVRPDEQAPRTGDKEAKRARERAALIAGYNPAQATEVQQLVQELATRLSALIPDTYRPAHGGFKASQLLFHSHMAFVVDFDGFCLADSALDVGYFLAYLRPSGLWYGRAGMREWFEASAAVFKATYQEAMRELGVPESSIEGILERSRLYEAALLFKIATRRVNRLNSPRSKELAAMLDEIAACLSHDARRG